MIKVLIVDDHAVVRRGVRQILAETSGRIRADEAASGEEALRAIRENDYEIVLLDMALPDISGLEIINQIRSMKPNLSVLVLSMYPEDQYAVRVLRAGADGYLTKESAPEELIAAIDKVYRGGKYVTQTLAERLAANLDQRTDVPLHDALSNRELQVMRLLATGLKVSEIGTELTISPKTVSTYRARILEKLGLKSTAEIIRYAIEHGLAE